VFNAFFAPSPAARVPPEPRLKFHRELFAMGVAYDVVIVAVCLHFLCKCKVRFPSERAVVSSGLQPSANLGELRSVEQASHRYAAKHTCKSQAHRLIIINPASQQPRGPNHLGYRHIVEDLRANEIGLAAIRNAVTLVDWYLNEAIGTPRSRDQRTFRPVGVRHQFGDWRHPRRRNSSRGLALAVASF
jgi:hypothetical protein